MKQKIIIMVLVLITLFAVSFVILKLQTNKDSEIIENNTSESINNDNLEELEQDNKEDELTDDNSNDEEKTIEQESPKESQTTKEEKKTNNSSSNNTSSNQNKKEESSSNKKDNKQSVESKPVWEELGISEYDYYHKPMWSWAKIDYFVDTYGTEEATHRACIDAGNKLENITSYTCYNINSYSGDYLGDMLEIKEG